MRVLRQGFDMAAMRGTSARIIFLLVACACLVEACGHPPVPSPSSAASSQPSTSATPAVDGCGTYCRQAGVSQGGHDAGYPCPLSGCRKCPPKNCVTLESFGATVTNGAASIELRCNLRTACHGAFLICLPSYICSVGQTFNGIGGRLAASDFVIPPEATGEVEVALTALGKQVVSGPGGFVSAVLVDLLDYGLAVEPPDFAPGNFRLTSNDPPSYPAGAIASCGGIVFVGPRTSCPFADNVEQAYARAFKASGGSVNAVSATSPVTGEAYEVQCSAQSPIVCRGGNNALVEFYY